MGTLRINRRRIGMEICVIGAFFLSYYIRLIVVPANWGALNLAALIGVALILFVFWGQFLNNGWKRTILLLLVLLTVLFFLTQLYCGYSLLYTIKYWTTIIPPFILIYLDVSKPDFEKLFSFFLRCLNIFVYIMFFMLIVDMFTGKQAMHLFAALTGNETILGWVSSGARRYTSINGHYIATAHIYIVYYIFNMIAQKCRLKKRVNVWVVSVIALLGVCATASKGSILVLVVLVVLFHATNIKEMAVYILIAVAAFAAGVFDSVIERFLTTDLTTGRGEAWDYVSQNIADLYPIFIGHGTGSVVSLNSMTNVTRVSAAFEYPFLQFEYELGMAFAVLFFVLAFCVPMFILIKRKRLEAAVVMMIYIVLINTFNGIANFTDYFWQYCVYVFFFLQLSKYDQCKLFRAFSGNGRIRFLTSWRS